MCVVIPFILDVRLVDVPAGVTQEEDHTGFLHLPSAVFALNFCREGKKLRQAPQKEGGEKKRKETKLLCDLSPL